MYVGLRKYKENYKICCYCITKFIYLQEIKIKVKMFMFEDVCFLDNIYVNSVLQKAKKLLTKDSK